MYCHQCGAQIDDSSKFCGKCGAPVNSENKDTVTQNNASYNPAPPPPQPAPQYNAQPAENDGIFGILGLVFAFIIPLLGLIFSIIGLGKTTNRGYAKAGLIISILYFALVFLIVIIIVTTSASFFAL
ncbi:MAG: zinc ribbon domain-containing protein [Clostridiales bacterium]|nr:zinc ribbon domain-containing protein [Clostridiales bacterium]